MPSSPTFGLQLVSTVLPMTGQTSYILSVQGSGPLFNISIHPLAGRFVPNLIYLSMLFLSLFIEVALLLPCTILHPLCQPLSILKNIWQLSLLSLVSQAAVCPQCHNYHLCIWGYSLVFGYRNCSTRRYNINLKDYSFVTHTPSPVPIIQGWASHHCWSLSANWWYSNPLHVLYSSWPESGEYPRILAF